MSTHLFIYRWPSLALLLVAGAVTVCLSACSSSPSSPKEGDLKFSFDFAADTVGWQTGFADYPATQQADVDFVADHRPIPGLTMPSKAFYQKGVNISDDLIMYYTKQVGGLEPNQRYRSTFQVEFASNYGDDCAFGVGALVYIKAGISHIEPTVAADSSGWIRLNIDKGQQENDGANALLLGDIRNGQPGCDASAPYAISSRSRENAAITVQADSDGKIWLFFGSESSFESVHHLFFTRFVINLEPI